MFLTREEVQELTSKKRLSSQVAVLNSLGIVYKLRPDGSPVVLKAHIEQLFGGQVAQQSPKITWEPDWDALAAQEKQRAAQRRARQEAKSERVNASRKGGGLDPLG